jgi:hypothetical protein
MCKIKVIIIKNDIIIIIFYYLFRKMIMPDFSLLSLNDLIIPEFPEIPDIIQNTRDILDCETIKDLFLYLYLNASSNIAFEELQQKLIEFYFQDATHDLISKHLDVIYDMFHVSYWFLILQITNRNHYDNSNDFDVQLIIEFILSSHGTQYLQEIYNMNCVMV